MNTDQTDCPTRRGTGQYTVMRTIQPFKIEPSICPDCGGTGKKTEPKPVRILSRMGKVRRTRQGV
jgi:DnaJ-class molecular chaperone